MSQRISDLNVRNTVIIGGTGDANASAPLDVKGNIKVSGNSYLGDGNGDQTHINDILYLGATDSGDAHFYFGENSSNWYGSYMNWDSGHRFSWYSRHAGTNTRFMYFDTNSTTYLYWERNFDMKNREINYVSQLHFNDNVRFYDDGNDSYLNFKYGDTGVGGIRVLDGNNQTQVYLYGDGSGNGGLLTNSGEWGVRLVPNSKTSLYYNGSEKLETIDTGIKILGNGLDSRNNFLVSKRHSGSDFVDGTLVTTDIPANVTNGASFVLEATGKSYSANPPFSFIAQGYLYNNTIINYSGQHFGFAGFSSMKVFEHSDGTLAFWWPRVSYWNSFEVSVRDAGGSPVNRVVGITNSTEPSSSKKVSIDMKTTWHSGNFNPSSYLTTSGKAADSDLLDGYDWMQSGKSVRANEFYADNWFRNYNSGEGLYNEATAQHLYSDSDDYWTVTMGGNSRSGIRIRDAHASTVRGYLMANTSNQVGLLTGAGEWAFKATNNGASEMMYNAATKVATTNTGVDINGTLTMHSGGSNSYARIRGYSNDNHFITIRGAVATGTSTLSITGAHQTTFVEHANDANEGWYFVSKASGNYTEMARIDGLSRMYLGGNKVATESWVTNTIVNSAPGTLDTLNELAAALGDDPNFATSTSTALGNRLRVDTASQGLTSTQKSNGRTNLGLGSAATSNTSAFAASSHTHSAGDITSGTFAVGRLSGTYNIGISGVAAKATRVESRDNRTISPSEDSNNELRFGFTSFNNNNTAPWADYLHLRSYGDSSGGNDNLLVFSKSTKSMRLYQQSYGSSTAYSSYVDFWSTGDFTGTNVNNWNTAYGWGNHASQGYLTSVPRDVAGGTKVLDRGIEFHDNGGDLSWAIGADDRGGVGAPGQNALVFRTRQGARFQVGTGWAGEGTEVMTLDDSGNVGIGVPQAEITERLNVQGNVRITGTLEAAEKSFNIPHPTKEGKRLIYGVLEGPEHGVYVRGKSTEKVVELPEEWTGLVHEDSITVQLTCKGRPFQIWVEDIRDNKVYINTDVEDFEYYYNVQGERKDVDKLITERDAN